MRRGIVVLALGALSCARAPAPRPDVVLVTIDTWRHDAAGFAGNARLRTPAFDALAREGVVFETARAHAVVTLPSHASILTGRLPFAHGARDNGGFTLDPDVPTLATVLAGAGWRTGAFVSAFPLDRRFGLARGFEVYDDAFAPPGSGAVDAVAERDGGETVARALAWWRATPPPRFLWVHLYTPHFPYAPPEPFRSRFPGAPYWGEVERADAEIAPLLDAVRGAVVALTGDHGESLGEHGEATHGLFAYDATLLVPLVVAAPGRVAPGRVRRAVSHADLFPTICALAGVPPPGGLPGRSLLDGAEEESSYFEALSAHYNRDAAALTGIVSRGMKAIRLPEPELYDLARDPGETVNLAASDPERLRDMLSRLPEESLPGEGAIDDETRSRLASLGYLRGDGTGGVDPKRLVADDARLDGALTLWKAGDRERAVAEARALVVSRPAMAAARSTLASFLADLGRVGEAASVLAAGASSEPERTRLALLRLREGRADDAARLLSGLDASRDPETQSALGRIAAARGDRDEARRRFERALALDPTYPEGLADLGTLLLDAGDLDGARAKLEEAVAQAPSLAEAWTALGVVRDRGGDEAGAIAAWERATEADATVPDPWYNLAAAYARTGARKRAASAIDRYAALVHGEERERALAIGRSLR